MALTAGELAQIVWAETGQLGAAKADGTGELNEVRRLVAQLAAAVDGKGFEKRAALPPVTDPQLGNAARAVMLIAENAVSAAEPQLRLIIWPQGSDTTRPAISNDLPQPWGNVATDGITHQATRPYGKRSVDIFSRIYAEGAPDGAVLVNAITGTGTNGGKPLIAPGTKWAGQRSSLGYWLFILAVALFCGSAIWAYGLGVASRLTLTEFQEIASIKPTTPNAPAPPIANVVKGAQKTATDPATPLASLSYDVGAGAAGDDLRFVFGSKTVDINFADGNTVDHLSTAVNADPTLKAANIKAAFDANNDKRLTIENGSGQALTMSLNNENAAGAAKDLTPLFGSATVAIAAGTLNCDPTPPNTIPASDPPAWRRQAKGSPDCRVMYATSQQAVAAGLNKEKSWRELFAAKALSLAGAAGWSASIIGPLALAIVALSVLFISTGYGVAGRPMGAIIDQRFRMSLTLVQLVLWSVVVLGGWLVLGLYNIGVSHTDFLALHQKVIAATQTGEPSELATSLSKLLEDFSLFPRIPYYLMAVLGFAAATPFLSRLISQTNLVSTTPATAQQTPGQTPQVQATVPSYLEANSDPSEAKLADMVTSETEGAGNIVDASRVQYAAITGILVIGYLLMLFDAVASVDPMRIALAANASKSVFTTMPPIDGTFVALLGVSHAALLTAKIYDKKTTEPATPAQPNQ